MIHAEIDQRSENLVFVRFSDPNEDFGSKPFFMVDSIEEAHKRVRTRNKVYILETLTHWLNQRSHANTKYYKNISVFLTWIGDVRKKSFKEVCDFVEYRRPLLEAFAPPIDSKFYPDYQNKIIPILDFCCSREDQNEDNLTAQSSL
ncbi:hypothetical protein [Pedobacter ginsengisoli]|uniref:hypothetical protein n=1 Tax=Pedobacter ginsengisoli TaxID=363852 RepID=UPI00254D5D32|nr:hypothetical protein [Pedobacter ginsengisoli]